MKHNIRIKGEVQELDCELGSDILDKNGREIFEGNKVKTKAIEGEFIRRVVFMEGSFYLKGGNRVMTHLEIYDSENLEIVD